MRAVVQRVLHARVTARADAASSFAEVGRIGPGLAVLLGVTQADDAAAATSMATKLWHLRIFADPAGAMNLAAADVAAEILVVPQFTLHGDTRKGRRPSFVAAARPEQAEPLIAAVTLALRELGAVVATGRFRSDMRVELTNDGPVTVLIET